MEIIEFNYKKPIRLSCNVCGCSKFNKKNGRIHFTCGYSLLDCRTYFIVACNCDSIYLDWDDDYFK